MNTQTETVILDMLKDLSAKVDEVREKVARMEGANTTAAIEKLEKRVDALESERDKITGATKFVTWLSRNAPWIVAILAAAAVSLGLQHK